MGPDEQDEYAKWETSEGITILNEGHLMANDEDDDKEKEKEKKSDILKTTTTNKLNNIQSTSLNPKQHKHNTTQ